MPKQNKSKMRQKACTQPMEFVCVSQQLLATESVLECDSYTETALEKAEFPFNSGYRLQIVSWLGVGVHMLPQSP